MTRSFGRRGRRGPRAMASGLTTHAPAPTGSSYGDWCFDHYCKTDEVCVQGVCMPKGMFRSGPGDPGWHSTGAPRINSLSSVRHMATSGKKYQTIRGRNLQTIQRVFMKRVHAANPIETELRIVAQPPLGTELQVEVPTSAGINFSQGRRLFLTDMQPWTYEFGPGDIGASKLFSSKPSGSSSSRALKIRAPRRKRRRRGRRR